MQSKINIKTIVLSCAGVLTLGAFTIKSDLFQVSKNLDIFASVYKELNMNYVDEVNSSKLVQTSISAMLDDLDPYTEFVPESDIEDYKMKYVSTQYGGIGAAILYREGKIYISEPFEGYPAHQAGLKAGDELLTINNQKLKGKNNDEVSALLKGAKETPLTIQIKRNEQLLVKELKRAEIKQPNVTYYTLLDNNIGYIKLDKFLENSAQEFKDALLDLKKQNIKGLIIDLRFNGGGILQEAVKIVNLFVNKDIEVVSQKGRNATKSISYKTFTNPIEADLPLAVLINSRSASASEIVAGSLQDLDRGVVIGQRSFGKGLVQQTFNTSYNTLVKVTVAKYYTPSGRCIQALDYTHRTEDGNVEKVADSLITEYKTKGGRSVYDGSGIYPDLFLEPVKYHHITQTLVNKFHIFDFATQYVTNKSSVSSAKKFKLTDNEYLDFINFLKNKDIKYQTQADILLKELNKQAEKNKDLEIVKTDIQNLELKINKSKTNDLVAYKTEIKKVLESEIIKRYYFDKGRIEQGFQYDDVLHKAQSILISNLDYKNILTGVGSYKTIGKPSTTIANN